MELTLAEKLECVMLHLKDGVPLYDVANKSNIYIVLDKMYENTNKMLVIAKPNIPIGFEKI